MLSNSSAERFLADRSACFVCIVYMKFVPVRKKKEPFIQATFSVFLVAYLNRNLNVLSTQDLTTICSFSFHIKEISDAILFLIFMSFHLAKPRRLTGQIDIVNCVWLELNFA